ncbi:MAG: hypothetical protein HQK53_07925, partial [Oligoflexia bacterium]|nr:hypothetical protein [Oligoflexia bacterium]
MIQKIFTFLIFLSLVSLFNLITMHTALFAAPPAPLTAVAQEYELQNEIILGGKV